MNGALGFAVWGSLAGTAILGAFLLVQAIVDPANRRRFAALSVVMGYLATLDFCFSLQKLSLPAYEQHRLVWCGLYVAAIHRLFGSPMRLNLRAGLFPPLLGFGVFYGGYPELATTVAYPFAFGMVAFVHFCQYLRGRGYSSVLLSGCSAVQAAMCGFYYLTLQRGGSGPVLGYLNYAIVTILAVLLGWVHLPRELRGRSPVKVEAPRARAFLIAFLAAEIPVQAGLLWPSTPLFVGALAFQVAIAVAFYFSHRHQLVIHADNVGLLLEERTKELRSAQAEVARQNERLEERLAAQATELQAKTRVIERQRRLELAAQTAGQAAHDIQNLVAPLLARIDDLAELRSVDGLREQARALRRQAGQLLDLNTQLLALARRGRLEAQPVELAELAVEVASRFPAGRIQVERNGPAWTMGSSSQLSRAVSNLLSNALESDPSRDVPVALRVGTADVPSDRRCHLGFLAPGRYVRIDVEDRGPGIPERDLDRIFEPFFSSKSRSGSGLGLTIVAAVVDDHRGVLDLETGPGGTRFTIYLPATGVPSAIEDELPLSPPATLLVVDDDSSLLSEYGDSLRAGGFKVLFAESGEQAIRKLQDTAVDVLLLDYQMGGMDGLQTFFGALHVRPGVAAVVHTSHLLEPQALQLRALGVSSILMKPAGHRELLRALRDACRSRRSPPA